MFENTQDSIREMSLTEILALPFDEREKVGLLYTPQEIFQQPDTWRETFQIIRDRQPDIRNFLHQSGLNKVEKGKLFVSLIGAGTSDYIGRALVALLRKNWKCRVEAIPSTDLLTEMNDFLDGSPENTKHLWISFSRSGDSFEGVRIIEKALENYPNIFHLVVTCNENGRMKELCDANPNTLCIVLDKKTNDLGLAMTSSFTNMIVAGQCLSHIEDSEKYAPVVETLSWIAAENLLDIAALAKKIAAMNYTRICFLGSGALKSVGAESALKVVELTAGHCSVMSESFLGLRHGPLSWLNRESLVVGFVSNDAEKSKVELGLIEELKRKRAAKSILVILPNDLINAETSFQISFNVPKDFNDNYEPPVYVLFAQCLGLYASLMQGLKPDNPSVDGKIQRVVSQIE